MSTNQSLKPITTEWKDNLTIGGCDLVELANKYGTPLYVIDEVTLRQICRDYKEAFKNYPNIKMMYASKALCSLATTAIIDSEGFGFDTVSAGEIYTVYKAGVDMSKVLFNGNNKTRKEIELALELNVGRFSVDNFLEAELLNKIAKEKDLVIIVDEVQTGNGRTGALYGYMKFNVTPDIVSTAKGIGGGLPLGATMFFEKTENVYTPGSHGSTFGGNPVATAGAYNIISRLDDEFLNEVEKKHDYIVSELSSCEGVKGVTGLGLMLGVETVKDVNQVLKACQENGVLPIKAKNKLRLLPPLNISFEELEKAINVIKNACV